MNFPAGFPLILDGANVFYAAETPSGIQGSAYDTGEPVAVAYLAIARYQSDAGVYLFRVSEQFEVIGDSLWSSVAEAMEVTASSGLTGLSWVELPATAE